MKEFAKSILELKVVRYFISAITATFVDISTYYCLLHYFFKQQNVVLFSHFTLAAPTASLIISFSCGLITSFTITRLFVFTESDLKAHHQFMRFTMVAAIVFVLNYTAMTLLIKHFNWYPTIARAFSAVSIGVLSFFTHKFFTFKVSDTEETDKIA